MNSILVVGGGPIGQEYIKTLQHLDRHPIDILTNSETTSAKIKQTYSLRNNYFGGNETLRAIAANYDHIFIAVPVDDLLQSLTAAVSNPKCSAKILVEKPVALKSTQLCNFIEQHQEARVFGALNRFYFPSILALRKRLRDTPPLSGRFCFTEWTHTIPLNQFSADTLERWGIANSIHLIATFFEIVGHPTILHPLSSGNLSWHPAGARFYGSGVTEKSVLFTYDADWESSGRHHIEVFTEEGAYILRPLHELCFIPRGGVKETVVESAHSGDLKCGFLEMVSEFLTGSEDSLEKINLKNLIQHQINVEKIFEYTD